MVFEYVARYSFAVLISLVFSGLTNAQTNCVVCGRQCPNRFCESCLDDAQQFDLSEQTIDAPTTGAVLPVDSLSQPSLAFTEQSAAFAPSSVALPAPGYIDPATIRSRVRFRYDFAKGANFPDRAEYFYPAPFNTLSGSVSGGRGLDYNDGGPTTEGLNFHELRTYLEWSPGESNLFSVFGEFPARIVNNYSVFGGTLGGGPIDPIRGDGETHGGAGDFVGGLRLSLFEDVSRALTAQVKVFTPTGNPLLGLGTGHTSIEAGVVGQARLSDRITVCGEVHDWVAINASNVAINSPDTGIVGNDISFGGNVLRYGLGLGVDLLEIERHCQLVTGFVEVVGWSVLDGFKTSLEGDNPVFDANGDFILNGKYGVRWSIGRNSFYGGYGHNWTSERWYSDLFRFEFTHQF